MAKAKRRKIERHKLITDPATFKIRRRWKTDYLCGRYWRKAECGIDLTEGIGSCVEEYSELWKYTTCKECLQHKPPEYERDGEEILRGVNPEWAGHPPGTRPAQYGRIPNVP